MRYVLFCVTLRLEADHPSKMVEAFLSNTLHSVTEREPAFILLGFLHCFVYACVREDKCSGCQGQDIFFSYLNPAGPTEGIRCHRIKRAEEKSEVLS